MTEPEATEFVESNPFARWDGYEIVIHRPDPKAYLHVKGIFHEEFGWGFEKRFKLNNEGYWV